MVMHWIVFYPVDSTIQPFKKWGHNCQLIAFLLTFLLEFFSSFKGTLNVTLWWYTGYARPLERVTFVLTQSPGTAGLQ